MNDAAAGAGAVASLRKRPLDEVMLAMDVVDTLRHRRSLVDRELDEDARDRQLMERLRRIYAAQGIEVPDRVLQEGVEALKEERFVYKPPARGLKTALARLYIRRGRLGRWLGVILVVLALAWGAYYYLVLAPRHALPGELESLHTSALEVALGEPARERAEAAYRKGQAALRAGDESRAREAIGSLQDLRTALEQEYTLRIVSRPGERSGVWRVPDLNSSARNYYIVVEALDGDGRPVTVPVTSEETGKTEAVSTWAVRVDKAVYDRVAADKQDDGIIQDNVFGTKRRGFLTPDYQMPAAGGAITRW